MNLFKQPSVYSNIIYTIGSHFLVQLCGIIYVGQVGPDISSTYRVRHRTSMLEALGFLIRGSNSI